jgi:DNA-binding transcriptional regulator YbjK
VKKWIEMAQEAIEWLKTISTQLDTTNAMLQALVVGQQRTQQQIMTISDIYIEAGKTPTEEQVAAEIARLRKKLGVRS